jgi:hypothetical protein
VAAYGGVPTTTSPEGAQQGTSFRAARSVVAPPSGPEPDGIIRTFPALLQYEEVSRSSGPISQGAP